MAGQRRAQLVGRVGCEDALPLASRVDRRDRSAREYVRCNTDQNDDRQIDGDDGRDDVTHRGGDAGAGFGSTECGPMIEAYSRATNAYAPTLNATSTQIKTAR